MDTAEHLELFIKGAIIGQLVGDALGYPYENVADITELPAIEMVSGQHGETLGAYSSSSALMLATLENINEYKGIDQDDLMEKFNDVYIAGYLNIDEECKDVSSVTSESINNYANGIPLDRCGNREQSNNEALLRALPIGLFYATSSIDVLVDQSHKICCLTHSCHIDQVACAAYSLIISSILLQKGGKVFEHLADYYQVKKMNEHASALEILYGSSGRDARGTKDTCDSFWSAWKSHQQYESDYQYCVNTAIGFGNDTNGTASLAGSFSGLSNGLNDIPARWLRDLSLTAHVMEIIQSFVDSVIQKTVT